MHLAIKIFPLIIDYVKHCMCILVTLFDDDRLRTSTTQPRKIPICSSLQRISEVDIV